MKNNEKNIPQVDKAKFEFIQQDSKIYDKKFETKPIGYFKDAMIRFTKNRTNVVASLILLTLILLSVFVPVLTSKNYTVLESQIANLPPRIPGLEKLGIIDGSKKYEAQTVDRSTVDPETGLGYPNTILPEFIIPGTLENYVQYTSEISEIVYGGKVSLLINTGRPFASLTSPAADTFFMFDNQNPEFIVDVDSMTGQNAKLEVVITHLNEQVVVKTITSSGIYRFNPLTEAGITGYASTRATLRFSADSDDARLLLNKFTYVNNTQTDPVKEYYGYNLYMFDVVDGNKGRQDGELLLANFRYDIYGEVFAERRNTNFPRSELEALILAYPDQSKMPQDLNDYEAILNFEFPEGFAIKDIYSYRVISAGGRTTVQFDVLLDYAALMGYDDIPYFLFGTTAAGHDLFALSWFGLRTSLIIGLISSAINIFIGIIYGAISGYYGGKVDLIMERISEVIGRIPWLVTLSIFIALFGPGALTLILILIISGWIGIASVTRTQFYRYKGREYVLASRTLGANDARLIFRHILPNGIGTIITGSVLMIPYVIFTEASLSYLGYGIGHGQSFKILGINLSGVSIGVLLSDGRAEMVDKPYLTIVPAIIISILMITFNMFGNALRDAFNPSLRGSE